VPAPERVFWSKISREGELDGERSFDFAQDDTLIETLTRRLRHWSIGGYGVTTACAFTG
jgi:hypothetical protein